MSSQEVVHSVRTGKLKLQYTNFTPGNRVNVHEIARLISKGREAMVRVVVEGSLTKAAGAWSFEARFGAGRVS